MLDTNAMRRIDTAHQILVREARKLKNQDGQIAINPRSLIGLVVKIIGSKKNETIVTSIQKSTKAVRHAGNS